MECQIKQIKKCIKDYAHADENNLDLADLWTRLKGLLEQHKCNFKK